MRKILLTFSVLCIIYTTAHGQELHTPAEILQLMEKSSVTYELNALAGEVAPPDRIENLNFNHQYRVVKENRILTYGYEIKSDAKEALSLAEKHFKNEEFAMAREQYLKVLDIDPTYYRVMTYIGQIYGIEGNFNKAIEWYTKTIDLNYIDYMAHWFLADAYVERGESEKALSAITIAQILNRNNPRVKVSYDKIYKLNKLNTDEWTFVPQIKIDSIDINKVRIAFDPDWLGYAMVKAVWKYEPGYKEAMGQEAGATSILEEKECILGLIPSFNKKKLKKYPEFKALQLAMDNDMVDEFILYEIILPDYPFVAYQLSEELTNDIKNYVIKVRGKQK